MLLLVGLRWSRGRLLLLGLLLRLGLLRLLRLIRLRHAGFRHAGLVGGLLLRLHHIRLHSAGLFHRWALLHRIGRNRSFGLLG